MAFWVSGYMFNATVSAKETLIKLEKNVIVSYKILKNLY